MASRNVRECFETPACAERMRSSQPPSPYPGGAPRGGPKLGPRGPTLPRLRPSSRVGPRCPARCPGRRRRSGRRSVPGIPGGGSVPAGQVRGGPGPSPRAIPPWGQVRALPGAPLRGTASCPSRRGPRTGSPRRARCGPARGPAADRQEGAQRRPAAASERHGLRPVRHPERPPAPARTRGRSGAPADPRASPAHLPRGRGSSPLV